MRRLLSFLLHPLSVAGITTVLLAVLFFPSVPEYELTLADQSAQQEELVIHCDDLDGNGYSDQMVFLAYPGRISGFTLHLEPSMAIREYTFPGTYDMHDKRFFLTGDYNGDRVKEIVVFTVSNDSLFLHCISGFVHSAGRTVSRFIGHTGKGPATGTRHLNLVFGGWEDLNGDGWRELIFATNFGLSELPRTIYRYDFKRDRLIASGKNGYHVLSLDLEDIAGDSCPEIIVNGYASQNYTDTASWPVNDLYCRLIVLDRNLDYLFPPVRFPDSGYCQLTTHVFSDNNGKRRFFSLYIPPLETRQPARLLVSDPAGRPLREKEVPGQYFGKVIRSLFFRKGSEPFLAFGNQDREIFIYDTALNLVRQEVAGMRMIPCARLDADGDGETEIISLDGGERKIGVFRADLSDPAILKLPFGGPQDTHISLKTEPGKPPLIVVDSGSTLFFLAYGRNTLYYTRWLFVAAIFLALWLFALLTGRLQRIRLEAKMKTEKKITELQLTIVRNQLDPHFTLNAINAVTEAVGREEKEAARENLLHFSKMYRSLLLSADRIKRTLREEIEFTESYLALERFRFGNRFEYRIVIGPEVDQATEVPKMVIQSAVENAVKHGIRLRESGGQIRIVATREGRSLTLEISDNGPGRAAARAGGTSGTGKGIQSMEQFFDLYRKVTGVTVTAAVTDLEDAQGKPSGTLVRIVIRED